LENGVILKNNILIIATFGLVFLSISAAQPSAVRGKFLLFLA
jgi:hypothetical protein